MPSPAAIAANLAQKTDKFNATAAEKVGRDPEALEQVSITLSVSSTSSRRVHTSHSSLSTLLTSGLSSSPTVSLSTSSAFGPLSTNGESNSNGSTSDQKTDLPAIIGGRCPSHSLCKFLEIYPPRYRCCWWSLRLYYSLVIDLVLPPSPLSRGPPSRRSSSALSPHALCPWILLPAFSVCVQLRARDG